MNDEITNKIEIERLKISIDRHEDDIRELKSGHKDLNEALAKIQKTLDKMLWLTTGAALAYIANTLGLTHVISKLFL